MDIRCWNDKKINTCYPCQFNYFINLRQFILAGTNTTQDSLISVFIIVGITVIGIYYILNHKVTEID
ncbi:hypothetical protein BM535_21625 [Clostridioides difficile]|nr:hypothetical protein BM535_21625 [Clostridioides difficile]